MLRNPVLLNFKPLFPAVTYRCNLCGEVTAVEQTVKFDSRDLGYTGSFLFCKACSPMIQEVAGRLAQREAELDSVHETIKAKELAELVEFELEAVGRRRQHGPVGHSAPPSDERPSPRSRQARATGQIPNPKA